MKPDGLRDWLTLLDLCIFQPTERLLASLLRLTEALLETYPMSFGTFCIVTTGWLVAALIVARVSGVGAFVMLVLLAFVLFAAARNLP